MSWFAIAKHAPTRAHRSSGGGAAAAKRKVGVADEDVRDRGEGRPPAAGPTADGARLHELSGREWGNAHIACARISAWFAMRWS